MPGGISGRGHLRPRKAVEQDARGLGLPKGVRPFILNTHAEVSKAGKCKCERTDVQLWPSHSPFGSGFGPLILTTLSFLLGSHFLGCGVSLIDRLARRSLRSLRMWCRSLARRICTMLCRSRVRPFSAIGRGYPQLRAGPPGAFSDLRQAEAPPSTNRTCTSPSLFTALQYGRGGLVQMG
jgi:hypothetical protein